MKSIPCYFIVSLIFIILGLSGGIFSPVAHAATLKELEAEVLEFKRINDTQAKNLANALNQVQEIVSEFQGLSGRADQGLHENMEQARLIADAQRRVDILEDKIAILVKQLEELKTAGLMSVDQVKNLKEFQEYEKGLSLLNAEDYKGAVSSLKQFMAGNPKSPLVQNAQYWVGESYYAMRDFTAAVAEMQKVVQKYPSGVRVASSLLKQGFSFYEMQSFDDARAFLSKVVAKYPGSHEAALASERIKKIDALLEKKALETMEKKEGH